MHTNKKIFIFIVFAVLIGFGIYEVKINQTPANAPATPPATVETHEVIQNYFCSEGVLKVSYGDQQATLHLLDGRSMTLPQVMSGSGVRYESGTTTFITKGNDAYLQEGDKPTYSNCIAGTDESGVFTDGSKMFRFTHPTNLSVSGGEIGFTTTWRNNVSTLGMTLATTTIPRETQPKTNFSEAKFNIGTSSDPQAIKDCLIATNGESAKGDVVINGVTYKKFVLGDAGAGNYYDTTSYRTMRDSQCYAVEYTIHSTNIGNYSPDQGIKAYDKTAITSELESMVQSFMFLPSTN